MHHKLKLCSSLQFIKKKSYKYDYMFLIEAY